MKLIKKFIGQKTYCKTVGLIEINEENIPILLNNNKGFLFTDGDELEPIEEKAEPTLEIVEEKEEVLNEGLVPDGFDKDSYNRLLAKVSEEALDGFQDREAKDVKKDLEMLGVDFPKTASKKTLANIVKKLK